MSHSSAGISDERLAIIDDLEMLREDLTAELQTINQYHGHMLILDDDEATITLEHIAEGKKEHVAELSRLIQNLGVVQAEKFRGIS